MRTLQLAGLGLCEHCRVLLSLEALSGDSMNSRLVCPECKNEVGFASFGYADASGKGGPVRWVGPDQEWVTVKPSEDFRLPNGTLVEVGRPREMLEYYY